MNKKTAIIGVAAVAAVVTMAAGIAWTQNLRTRLRESMIDQFAEQELIVATATARTLEREVDAIEGALRLIARIPDVRDGQTDACNRALKAAVEIAGLRIGNIGRIGRDGVFRCSLNAALIGVPGEKLGPYVADIFRDPQHKPVMSRMIVPPGAGEYVVAVHVPVFAADGAFDGTIGGAIYLSDLKEKHLKDIKMVSSGYATLRDDNGDILHHPREEFVGMNAHSDAFAKLTGRQGPAQDVDSQPSGKLRYVFEGKEKVAAFAHADVLDGRYWVVNVNVPIEDIESAVLNSSVDSVFPMIAALIVAASALPCLFLLFYLARTLFRPLARIKASIDKMETGDLEVSVPVTGTDEIGSLGEAFNRMAGSLRALTRDLERKVSEKTAELSRRMEEAVASNAELSRTKTAMLNLLEDLETEKAKTGEQQKLLQTLVDNVPIGIFVGKAPGGELIVMNKTGVELLGKPVDPTQTKEHYTEAYALEREDGTPYPIEDLPLPVTLRTGGECTRDDIFVRRPHASLIRIRATAAPVKDAAGKLLYGVGFMEDITQAKRLERAQTEFISLASHQLRTPLTALRWIVGTLKSLKPGPLNPVQADMVADAEKSGLRMAETIGTMLMISRLEADRLEPKPEDVRPAELLHGIVEEQRSAWEGKRQAMKTECPADLSLRTDRKILTEILANLLSNAVKYTPEEGKVSCTVAAEGAAVVFRVTDTGYGIPKDEQSHVFSRFFRAGNVTGMQTEGTGLGLYLVHSLVRVLGGTIAFVSEEKRGTTFTVTLPLTLHDHAADPDRRG